MRYYSFLISLIICFHSAFGQAKLISEPIARLSIADTPVMQDLILIKVTKRVHTVEGANNTIITTGKKADYLDLQKQPANLVTNNSRQVFGQVAGIHIWENEGSGLQTNVGTRGLSPNRSWEFNVRQNGVDISSEPFGYPEAYYQPTFEGVDHIEIVRGATGLQYGPQFGGLLNYVLKEAPKNRKISYQGNFTGGTYGLLGTYQQIGGTVGKLSYFGFGQYRRADGWRQNSEYQSSNFYGRLDYQFTERTKIWADYTRSNYVSQQAGGLNDSSFRANPEGSVRARNWFNVPWQVATLNLEHQFTDKIVLSWKNYSVFGERNSVGFTAANTVQDVKNASGLYSARQLDRDSYENFGSEIRIKADYNLFGNASSLAIGTRYFRGALERKQRGTGTRNSDFDLSETGLYRTQLKFTTDNIAFFAENKFQLTNKFAITAGARYESIVNNGSGFTDTAAAGKFTSPERTQSFVLFGAGFEYKLNSNNALYGNISQSYRPITFSDFTNNAANTIVVDPNLKAASGYSADLGIKGGFNTWLGYDAGVFFINYDNRVGTYTVNNVSTRANIGRSVNKGIEAGIDILPFELLQLNKLGMLKLNYNLGLVNARYVSWEAPGSTQDGKLVENAPKIISRVNISYAYKKLSTIASWSHVGKTYSDANNTATKVSPTDNGNNGEIPAYNVLDLSIKYELNTHISLSASVNNLTNNQYFTRRAGGYPGPGILPADGRTALIILGLRF